MELVSLRGRLMASCGTERPGGMAAIVGLPAEDVRALCETASEAGTVGARQLGQTAPQPWSPGRRPGCSGCWSSPSRRAPARRCA